jgi:hypothetical protein
LENLNNSEDINRAWEKFQKNIKTLALEILGLYELKQRKPLLDVASLNILDQSKHSKVR